ncbi:hypothetical protein [Galbibacter sp.]|uniref:hypothetical protein n=1 Tax=Galbibacter sp. TaxID=2918471 RepID=UPI003A90BAA1
MFVKKIICLTAMLLSSTLLFSQNNNVENSFYGIQTGFLGVWVHNESRLAPNLALRSEVGFNAGLIGGAFVEDGLIFAPIITLEPRYYYNIDQRSSKGKSTFNNAANFISFDISYSPDWFVISSIDNVEVLDNISFIPKWGIRRNLGKDFNYEAGIGLGYRFYFSNEAIYTDDQQELAADIHLRIGYTF